MKDGGAIQMMVGSQYRSSIGLGLVIGVVALVVVTASLVHVSWSLTARTNVSDLAQQLNGQLIQNARDKMSALLDDATSTEQTLATGIVAGTVDISVVDRLEGLFLSFIRSHPNVSAIEFGWLDDRAIAVRRLADDLIVAERTTPGESFGRRHTTRYEVRSGDLRRAETWEARVDSGVTGQFWFKQAFEIAGLSWSDIYRRSETGRLGFTTVTAVAAPNGEAGVLATSMELSQISVFLRNVAATESGAVFLTNSYGELVALGNGSAVLDGSPLESTSAVKLSDSGSPLVRIAAQALASENVSLANLKAARQLVHRAFGRAHFVTVSPLSQMGLVVGLIVPESEILGTIDRNTQRLAYILLAFITFMAALVARLAAFTLGKPLAAVTHNAKLLGDFRFGEIAPVSSRLSEINALSQAIGHMSTSLASFKKYVPTEVVRTLFAQGMEAELGGTHRDLTIFFMDLANFTQIAETKGEALIPFLGEFLSEMSDEIREGGGTIDKYIGDAIMAFWGAPVENEGHALFACRVALACQQRLETLRQRNPSEAALLHARIGINTGRVLVGNVGSRDRLNYTAIGDPVNVAARLEPLNKRYGTEILIGQETYAIVKDIVVARRLDRVAVYGKSENSDIFELLAMQDEATPGLLHWVRTYEAGIESFRRRAWDEAEELFQTVQSLRNGDDVPSRLMIERIGEYRLTPPPEDWNGASRVLEK
jgi:adenylate cyclase